MYLCFLRNTHIQFMFLSSIEYNMISKPFSKTVLTWYTHWLGKHTVCFHCSKTTFEEVFGDILATTIFFNYPFPPLLSFFIMFFLQLQKKCLRCKPTKHILPSFLTTWLVLKRWTSLRISLGHLKSSHG